MISTDLGKNLNKSETMTNSTHITSDNDKSWVELGKLIQRQRNLLGHTQREAAASANIAIQTWSFVEQGQNKRLRTSTALKIERYLGWPIGAIEDYVVNGIIPDLLEDVVADDLNDDELERLNRQNRLLRQQLEIVQARLDEYEKHS